MRSGAVSTSITGDDRLDIETPKPADAETPLARILQEQSPLFEDITPAQMVELRSVSREQRFEPGEHIFREGAEDPYVYVLIEGLAEVTKNTSIGGEQMRVAQLGRGDVLGELKIVDPQPSSATVVAVTQVTAFVMDLDVFAEAPGLAEVRATLLRNVGRVLAEKLRTTTGGSADAMQRELEESRARVHAGRFIVLIFTMLATYQLAISALVLVPESVRPLTSVLSFVFVIWAFIPVVLSLRRSPFSMESYGLTTKRAGPIALQALIWTLPLLAVVPVLKLAWLRWDPTMAGVKLFDPASVFSGRPFDVGIYLFAIGLYLIHAPLQEMVARAGLQGTLQNFIPTHTDKTNWKAILISNLLFAASHSFIGFWFCVAAFVPGLFWGWMFARQRSLVGVVVSHIAVGVWAIFVVGVQEIIGG
jgi:CRP-like cAMP-binding protein